MSEAARPPKPASPYAAIALTSVIFINLLGFGIIIPLLPFYAAQGKLKAVDGMAEMDEVTRQLQAILGPPRTDPGGFPVK